MQVLTPPSLPPPPSQNFDRRPKPTHPCRTTSTTTMFSKIFNISSKKGDASKPFEGDLEGLWYLDGKAYDLSKFVKMHPGEIKGQK